MQMIQQSLVTPLMITISSNQSSPYINHALLAPSIYKNHLFFLFLLSPFLLSLLTLHLLFPPSIFLAFSSLSIHQIPLFSGSHSLTKFVVVYLLSPLGICP